MRSWWLSLTTCSEGPSPGKGAGREIRAHAIGPAAWAALSTGGTGLRVHSVFPSSLNLEIGATGQLVALSGPSGRVYPHVVALARAEDFRDWGLGIGVQGQYLDGSIRIQGQGGSVVVDLRQALRPPLRALPRIRRLGSAHWSCKVRLSEFQDLIGCDFRMDALAGTGPARSWMGERLCGAARALGEATFRFNRCSHGIPAAAFRSSHQEGQVLAQLRRAVAALAGLGGGLTPSGDDFLCGFLAAARAFRPDPSERSGTLLAALNEAVDQNAGRTSQISAFLLRCGTRNFWPSPLLALGEALAQDHGTQARRALSGLCSLGHSSGADIATGFLFGLECLVAGAVDAAGRPGTACWIPGLAG
jgi:hypothetical protein